MPYSAADIEGLKKMGEEGSVVGNLNPFMRRVYGYLANNYGSYGHKVDSEGNPIKDEHGKEIVEDKRTDFGKRFDKYYLPFYQGMEEISPDDLPINRYKRVGLNDNDQKARRKEVYNKALSRYSGVDPFLAGGLYGAGNVIAGLGQNVLGGIPSLAIGSALKYLGMPVWQRVKQHFAKKKAKTDEANRYYKEMLERTPLR